LGYVDELREMVGHRPIILVGSVTIIVDDMGRLLLQQRKEPRRAWGITGGLMELGESTEDTARREIYEETGLIVEKLHLINVYSGPQHYIKTEIRDELFLVTIAYYTKGYKGELNIDKSESINFNFFFPDDLPKNIVKTHKIILDEFLSKFYKSCR
jgi:8-oxo-dGTP pyrophosphatase MutT (NUDIX family)